jgi:hypothetical protein
VPAWVGHTRHAVGPPMSFFGRRQSPGPSESQARRWRVPHYVHSSTQVSAPWSKPVLGVLGLTTQSAMGQSTLGRLQPRAENVGALGEGAFCEPCRLTRVPWAGSSLAAKKARSCCFFGDSVPLPSTCICRKEMELVPKGTPISKGTRCRIGMPRFFHRFARGFSALQH